MDGIATDYSVDLSVTSYSINARFLVLLPMLGSLYATGTSGYIIHSFYYLLRRPLQFFAIAHWCREVHKKAISKSYYQALQSKSQLFPGLLKRNGARSVAEL